MRVQCALYARCTLLRTVCYVVYPIVHWPVDVRQPVHTVGGRYVPLPPAPASPAEPDRSAAGLSGVRRGWCCVCVAAAEFSCVRPRLTGHQPARAAVAGIVAATGRPPPRCSGAP